MSTGIIVDRSQSVTVACFYCDTVGVAFGPVFTGDTEVDLAEAWYRDAGVDPRDFNTADEIREAISSWRDERRAELHVFKQDFNGPHLPLWRIASDDSPDAYLVGETFQTEVAAREAIAAGTFDFIWMD